MTSAGGPERDSLARRQAAPEVLERVGPVDVLVNHAAVLLFEHDREANEW